MKRNSIVHLMCVTSLAAALLSCSQDASIADQSKQVALNVSLTGISENDENTEITRGYAMPQAIQTVTVPVGNGMVLETTLERNAQASTRGTTALAVGVKYRVIAFKQDDVSSSGYISYADYEVGTTGAIAGELHVPVASTYTFVCYSMGTTTLPAFNQNSLDVLANPATDDLLYARFNQSITVASSTVSFSFAHKFSLVTVLADATNLSQNITAISASLSPNYPVTLALADGALTAGTEVARTISWENLTAGQTITSSPCTTFANGSNSVTVSIPSITIGGITKTNLTATFGSNSMQAGSKYTLRLKFKFSGAFLVGLTWAPGNLVKTGNAYTFTASQEYYSGTWNGGDSWGWCQLDPIVLTSYAGNYSVSLDPCQKVLPEGSWRMPTYNELMSLKNAGSVWTIKNGVNGRYFGTTDATTADANPNSYVFLPAAGFRDMGSMALSGVGAGGLYWSSTHNGTTDAYYLGFGSPYASTPNDKYRNDGFSIRCVK